MWQQMQQESAQELFDRQSQQALLIFMGRIAPAEGNLPMLEGEEAVMRNGHPMGVRTEIPQHLFRAAERSFAIGDPAAGEELVDEASKHSRLRQTSQQTVKLKLSGGVSLFECFEELAAEDLPQHSFREKKLFMPGADPLRVVE